MMANGKGQERPRVPHWMRSMEEKYHRLHARITDQAVRYSQSKNSLSVRLRELRQKKYQAQRGRNQCKSACDGRKESSLPSAIVSDPYQGPSVNRSLLTSSSVELPKCESTDNDNQCRLYEAEESQERGSDAKIIKRPSSTIPIPQNPPATDLNTTLQYTPFQAQDEQTESRILDAIGSKEFNENESKHNGDYRDETKNPISLSEGNIRDQKDTEQDKAISTGRSEESKSDTKTRPYSVPQIKNLGSTSNTGHSNNRSRSKTACERKILNDSNIIVLPNSSPDRKTKSKSAATFLPGKQSAARGLPVFSSMSREAQHAKHETLKEMTITDTVKLVPVEVEQAFTSDAFPIAMKKSPVDFDTTPESTNTSDNGEYVKPDDITKRPNIKTVVNSDKSVPSYEFQSKLNIAANHKDSLVPNHSSRSLKQQLKATPCYDPMTHRQEDSQLQRVSSPNLRGVHSKHQGERFVKNSIDNTLPYNRQPLPAIRTLGASYHPPPRENSFNITSPDFDVRFCGQPSFPGEDCDTTPEDIRRQSIEKCRLWLESQLGKI